MYQKLTLSENVDFFIVQEGKSQEAKEGKKISDPINSIRRLELG
jgi:hypothetical protein